MDTQGPGKTRKTTFTAAWAPLYMWPWTLHSLVHVTSNL